MKRKNGFSLTELIITMILIVILSLISMPIYKRKFTNNAKLAEGYALLGAIRDAQFSYYNEYGNFLHQTGSFCPGNGGYTQNIYTSVDPVLGISAVNNKYFTSFNYDTASFNNTHWKSYFRAKVRSAKAGTIEQTFNLTNHFDLTVINGNTNLSI